MSLPPKTGVAFSRESICVPSGYLEFFEGADGEVTDFVTDAVTESDASPTRILAETLQGNLIAT